MNTSENGAAGASVVELKPAAVVDPLLTDKEAAALLSISAPTFRRRVADGTVPQPIRLGSLTRWPQSEILDVIEKAKKLRPQVAA